MFRWVFLFSALYFNVLNLYADDSIPSSKHGLVGALYTFVKEFSRVDTSYVEPQQYNYAAMIQNTNSFEVYRLSSKNGMDVVFSLNHGLKLVHISVGVGYSWAIHWM